jgi:hypothetical protein
MLDAPESSSVSFEPITGLSLAVSESNNLDSFGSINVHDGVWKASQWCQADIVPHFGIELRIVPDLIERMSQIDLKSLDQIRVDALEILFGIPNLTAREWIEEIRFHL